MKVEGGVFVLDGVGVGVDVQGCFVVVGIVDFGSKGEMFFVGVLDGFDQEVWLGFVDCFQDLVEVEWFGIFVGFVGLDVWVGQLDDFLVDYCQGVGDVDDQDEELDGQGQLVVDEELEFGVGFF